MSRNGLPDPIGWGPPRAKRTNYRALQLTEISILRRLAQRQKPKQIAEALGMNPDSVTRKKRELREVFGVDSDDELLRHPDVIRQIGES